jgi:hypothetical protein
MKSLVPTRLLMLDSGAFSVWSSGHQIDFKEYLDFCEEFPDMSYFVCLDVIPRVDHLSPAARREHIESCCKSSFANYREMAERIPKHKIIPVFHEHDDPRWIGKYLDDGVSYLGISPKGVGQISWLSKIKPFLFDGAGRPLVRTHGFGVTSWDILKYMPWYSVDSATWQKVGSLGMVFVPVDGSNGFDFTQGPIRVRVSGNVHRQSFGKLYTKIHQPRRFKYQDSLMKFLDQWGIPLGTVEVKQEHKGYKLNRKINETWLNKCERIVLVPVEQGVTTTAEWRWKANVLFMRQANNALKDTVKQHLLC